MSDNKFVQIKEKLEKAQHEIVEALKVSNTATRCCGPNLDIVLNSLDKSIAEVNDHINKGINEKDLVK